MGGMEEDTMVKETEWRLGDNVIELPLNHERALVGTSLDLDIGKDINGVIKYRRLAEEEIEWLLFLIKKSKSEFERYDTKIRNLRDYIHDQNREPTKIQEDLFMFYETQVACSLFVSCKCCFLLERDLRIKFSEGKENFTAALQEVSNPNLTPAQKAAQAKSEKSLAAWKEVFPAMMKVYARCMEEGKKPRQRPDFYAMFNELDAELTDSQLAFFRSCLPEGHSDTDGGKPGKV